MVVDLLFVGAAAFAVGFSLRAALARGENRPEPSPPPQPLPPAPSSVQELLDRAVREAPERFAAARAAEERRRDLACAVCEEPTAIVCPRCGRRVCAPHRDDHGCAA